MPTQGDVAAIVEQIREAGRFSLAPEHVRGPRMARAWRTLRGTVDGNYQASGQLAVWAGHCGPGNLHLINGLLDDHRGGVPVLAIAAHIISSEIGNDYFQATHPESFADM
jgi:hypothetical protein